MLMYGAHFALTSGRENCPFSVGEREVKPSCFSQLFPFRGAHTPVGEVCVCCMYGLLAEARKQNNALASSRGRSVGSAHPTTGNRHGN